jgi:hypothetical protein
MPYSHGYEPQHYDDPSRPDSWGLYSASEKQWLAILFATKAEAEVAAMEMANPSKTRSKRGKYE